MPRRPVVGRVTVFRADGLRTALIVDTDFDGGRQQTYNYQAGYPLKISRWVTSKGLCQQKRGADALVLVFVVEDGEEDAIH
jgi:hypothetical protein